MKIARTYSLSDALTCYFDVTPPFFVKGKNRPFNDVNDGGIDCWTATLPQAQNSTGQRQPRLFKILHQRRTKPAVAEYSEKVTVAIN